MTRPETMDDRLEAVIDLLCTLGFTPRDDPGPWDAEHITPSGVILRVVHHTGDERLSLGVFDAREFLMHDLLTFTDCPRGRALAVAVTTAVIHHYTEGTAT